MKVEQKISKQQHHAEGEGESFEIVCEDCADNAVGVHRLKGEV